MTVAGSLSMIWTEPLKLVCADAVWKMASANQFVPATGPSIKIGYNTEHYNGLVLLVKFVQPRDSQFLSQDFHNYRSRVPKNGKRNGLTKTLFVVISTFLILSQMTNSRRFQNERVGRRQFQI